jgi:hypothetical protein
MIEDAQKIFDYLPQEYKTQAENDYVAFLWDAFTVNYEKEKYQFAYFAYHMLFMCLVYFQLAKIYLNSPEEIRRLLIFTGSAQTAIDNYEKKHKEATKNNISAPHFDPFSLAGEKERSIVGLFISIGCDRETIKRLKAIVDERNDIAHSNGNINFSNQYSFDGKIKEILECIAHIHDHTRPIITACTKKFLLESANPEENEFLNENDQVRELFAKGNYLSSQDILVACEFPIEQLKNEENYQYIEKLFRAISDLNVLDEYEATWSLTHHAVEEAMESGKWDDKTRTITLLDVPGLHKPELVSTRKELEDCLRDCASEVFYSNIPEDNERNFEAGSIVDDVLSNYEDQLDSFFSNRQVVSNERGEDQEGD